MFSWSCSLSSCDLSHIGLMGSCHNYIALLGMKAGHCTPSISLPSSLSHTQSPHFFSRMLTGLLQTLCDKMGTLQKSKACVLTKCPADLCKAVFLDELSLLLSLLQLIVIVSMYEYTICRHIMSNLLFLTGQTEIKVIFVATTDLLWV